MKKLLLILVAAYSIFAGCKKDMPKTIVHGIVSNRITGAGVGNVPINILECDGWPLKCLTTIRTGYTDVSGKYNISFFPDKRKSYEVEIGNNSIVSTYLYVYPKIIKNTDNTLNFAQFPLQNLVLSIRIQRHDKNFIQAFVQAIDTFGFYSGSLYTGNNPALDFDTTYKIKIEAGRIYNSTVILSNKTAPYTYQNPEYLSKPFTVDNVDTTRVFFLVQ